LLKLLEDVLFLGFGPPAKPAVSRGLKLVDPLQEVLGRFAVADLLPSGAGNRSRRISTRMWCSGIRSDNTGGAKKRLLQ
jgi:hypothetical protein